MLRGAAASAVVPARLDANLHTSPYAPQHAVDPRLVTPGLEAIFADAIAKAKEEARREGYADGRAAAMADARAGVEAAVAAAKAQAEDDALWQLEVLARAVTALERAVKQLEQRQAVAMEEMEDTILALAIDIAEALCRKQMTLLDTPVFDAVAEAVRSLPERTPVTLRLAPEDAAALATVDLASHADGREITLVADTSVDPGWCIADAGATRVDTRLSAAVARVREVLRG